MVNYWAMKTFKDWANLFIKNNEIGLGEEGVDKKYTDYEKKYPMSYQIRVNNVASTNFANGLK